MGIFNYKVPILIDDHAIVLDWYRVIGDYIIKNEILLELEVSKVVFELESPVSGTIVTIVKGKNAKVFPGDLLCRIEENGKNNANFVLDLNN